MVGTHTALPFPSPEPWPRETFELFGLRDLEQLVTDAQAEIARRRRVVEQTECGDCGDITHPAETVCQGCGAHLSPYAREVAVEEFGSDPFVRALDQACDVVTRPANVVALPGYSRRVS